MKPKPAAFRASPARPAAPALAPPAAQTRSVSPAQAIAHPPGHHHCACGGTCPRCAAARQSVQRTVAQPGAPLATPIRERAERQFGADLSDVRVHTDRAATASAVELGAGAFAAGRHIVFGPGLFAPGTTEGYRRLTHELAHVLQQPDDAAAHRIEPAPALEHEARDIAGRASSDPAATFDVAPRAEARGRVQRDDPPSSYLNRPDLLTPLSSRPEFQLKLSPEMQRMMLDMEFERWLAAQLARTPPPPDDASVAEPAAAEQPVIPSPAEVAAATESAAPLGPRIGAASGAHAPDALSADSPDVGAIMAPFLARGVPLGSRDPDAALQLYWRSTQWVSLLPEPPAPFSSWIPSDWRRSVAEAFTTTAIGNSSLRTDYPTAIEAFDRQLLNLTNDPSVVPTYINLPAIEWDFP